MYGDMVLLHLCGRAYGHNTPTGKVYHDLLCMYVSHVSEVHVYHMSYVRMYDDTYEVSPVCMYLCNINRNVHSVCMCLYNIHTHTHTYTHTQKQNHTHIHTVSAQASPCTSGSPSITDAKARRLGIYVYMHACMHV